MQVRAFHGVNLSGGLTLEPWVTPELFADSGALDEPTLVQSLGIMRYQEIVARHRKGFDHVASFVTYAKRYNASH